MFGKLIDKTLKKHWSTEEIEKYVGHFQAAYLAHSTQMTIRDKAASGGVTSALLIHGLNAGFFEAAVVCKTVILNGKVRPKFELATTAEEILAARGSKYVETRFLQEVLPLLRSFNGRVAVVGLPCDITALKRRCMKEPELAPKLAITFALVCGHNSKTTLIDQITHQLEKESGQALIDYRFRVGHWRGQLEAEFKDGSVIRKPTKYFNDYQNLFFFCERKCMACHDHYGYEADISIGDVWLFRLKNNPIKHSGIIIRNDNGAKLYQSAVSNDLLNSSDLHITDILDGQSRIGPAHYNVSARVKAGKFLNLKLKDTVNENVKWHDYLNAYISILNMQLSEKNQIKNLIFKTPRFIFKIFLYFKKALETLK